MSAKFKDGKCVKCGTPYNYCEVYDAEYCEKCDEWLIEKCGDPTCEFCANRPEKPSDWLKSKKR